VYTSILDAGDRHESSWWSNTANVAHPGGHVHGRDFRASAIPERRKSVDQGKELEDQNTSADQVTTSLEFSVQDVGRQAKKPFAPDLAAQPRVRAGQYQGR